MVTKKPKGLGRGLEALLGPKVHDKEEGGGPVAETGLPSILQLDVMVPGQYQPRTHMDEGALYELAESIKAQGIMQPILVRRLAKGDHAGKYEIIAGERRFRAARIAGLAEVPVLVRDVPNEAAAAMALIENIQREDLNPLEEALALQRMIEEFNLTHQQAAEAVGRGRSAVSNLLRLLEMPEEIRGLVERREIEMGHARALLTLPPATAVALAREAAADGLSVREVERRVQRIVQGAPARSVPGPKASSDADIAALENELSERLNARVAVQHGRGGKGRLVVHYQGRDALEGILEKLRAG